MRQSYNQLLFVALIPLGGANANQLFGLQIQGNETPGPKHNSKNKSEQQGSGAGMTAPSPTSSGARVTRCHSVV